MECKIDIYICKGDPLEKKKRPVKEKIINQDLRAMQPLPRGGGILTIGLDRVGRWNRSFTGCDYGLRNAELHPIC